MDERKRSLYCFVWNHIDKISQTLHYLLNQGYALLHPWNKFLDWIDTAIWKSDKTRIQISRTSLNAWRWITLDSFIFHYGNVVKTPSTKLSRQLNKDWDWIQTGISCTNSKLFLLADYLLYKSYYLGSNLAVFLITTRYTRTLFALHSEVKKILQQEVRCRSNSIKEILPTRSIGTGKPSTI